MKNRFDIDFFEFSFLVEACIPPAPIARSTFWDDVINKYYKVLNKEERKNLYQWINRNHNMERGIEEGNEQCIAFNARYNPDNQYLVHYDFNGNKDKVECFKIGNTYYTEWNLSSKKFISEMFITKVEKI